jgi:hypothetical protein
MKNNYFRLCVPVSSMYSWTGAIDSSENIAALPTSEKAEKAVRLLAITTETTETTETRHA